MWLSKLTRTGLLFPEESKPATAGFFGFGGMSSGSPRPKRSASSVTSLASSFEPPSSSALASRQDEATGPGRLLVPGFVAVSNGMPSMSVNGVFRLAEIERPRRANSVLVVLTHPELDAWHKIKAAVSDYDIGIVFVPLYDEEAEEGDEDGDLPVLQPLDPTVTKSLPVLNSGNARDSTWQEMKLYIDVDADVQSIFDQIVDGVKDILAFGTRQEGLQAQRSLCSPNGWTTAVNFSKDPG